MDKHDKHCCGKWKQFYLFFSVDWILGKYAQFLLNQLSWIMAKKLEEPVCHMREWVNGQIDIAAVWLHFFMIHGAHLSSTLREHETDCESFSDLGLAQ